MNPTELSAEEKILISASRLFTEKGFAATRTRDIAADAGINLALLNYYYRSKEKLFTEVMKLRVVQLFGRLLPILNNPKTDLEEKFTLASDLYFKVLTEHPDLPLFVLSEMHKKTSNIAPLLPIKKVLEGSVVLSQIRERRPDIDPFQILLNFLGMTLFPFMAQPVFLQFGILDKTTFAALIEERKNLIPEWMERMLYQKDN